jgi:hypothetical protein
VDELDPAGVVDLEVAGVGVGVAEVVLAAGAEEVSEAADFLDLEDLVEAEVSLAGVEDVEASDFLEVVEAAEAFEPEAASALSAFLDLEDFLVVEASAEAASVVSVFLDLEVDFFVEEVSAEALSVASDFLDFEDFLEAEESALSEEASDLEEGFLVEEAESAEVSSVDFFFFLDLLVEPESDWSVDWVVWGRDAARRERLPVRRSKAATSARKMGLRETVIFEESFRRWNPPPEGARGRVCRDGYVQEAGSVPSGRNWNSGRMMKEKENEVNSGKDGRHGEQIANRYKTKGESPPHRMPRRWHRPFTGSGQEASATERKSDPHTRASASN